MTISPIRKVSGPLACLGFAAICSVGFTAVQNAELLPRAITPLYCVDASGGSLPLRDKTFGDMVAAYRKKAEWKYTVQKLASGDFDIVFSKTGSATDVEVAIWHSALSRDGMVLKSIDYRSGGDVEHVPKGEVCFRALGLLS